MIRRGIARTFQNVELFRGDVRHRQRARRCARAPGRASGGRRALLREPSTRSRDRPASERCRTARRSASRLARALASGPQLLLLDEPAGGLSHEEVDQLGKFIRRMRDDFELTILLVEHHMGLVMSVADRVHVLDFGTQDR